MMKPLIATCLLLAMTVGAVAAAPVPHKPPRKNRAVAALAGAALHLTQDAQALQRASIRRREKAHGRHDPQVMAGRRNLRVIHRKMVYFRHAKRHGEGRR
jgi:hypothetical protein